MDFMAPSKSCTLCKGPVNSLHPARNMKIDNQSIVCVSIVYGHLVTPCLWYLHLAIKGPVLTPLKRYIYHMYNSCTHFLDVP